MAENRRVYDMKQALLADDFEAYFDGVMASGHSSFCYLQNVYTTKNIAEQGLSLALNLSERYLKDCKRPTAFRVHGGGFAGTIHSYVPEEDVEGYCKLMDSVFGEGACQILSIRLDGAVKLF
jgi:galactokinase